MKVKYSDISRSSLIGKFWIKIFFILFVFLWFACNRRLFMIKNPDFWYWRGKHQNLLFINQKLSRWQYTTKPPDSEMLDYGIICVERKKHRYSHLIFGSLISTLQKKFYVKSSVTVVLLETNRDECNPATLDWLIPCYVYSWQLKLRST